MFGNDDNDQSTDDTVVSNAVSDLTDNGSLGAPSDDTSSPATDDQTTPSVTEQASSFTMTDVPSTTVTPSAPSVTDTADTSSDTGSDTPGDLLSIKQQALQQLSPLVGHLEQSPEEKFRTTMMMIQASDDQSLVKVAFEAAQAITDEKAKAQALLDVVNEINYFTQQHKS